MISIKVLLPAPFGPTNPVRPGSISKLTLFSPMTMPYQRLNSRAWIIFVICNAGSSSFKSCALLRSDTLVYDCCSHAEHQDQRYYCSPDCGIVERSHGLGANVTEHVPKY